MGSCMRARSCAWSSVARSQSTHSPARGEACRLIHTGVDVDACAATSLLHVLRLTSCSAEPEHPYKQRMRLEGLHACKHMRH